MNSSEDRLRVIKRQAGGGSNQVSQADVQEIEQLRELRRLTRGHPLGDFGGLEGMQGRLQVVIFAPVQLEVERRGIGGPSAPHPPRAGGAAGLRQDVAR